MTFKSQRLSYFHDALALCTLDFPIFFIEFISERHVVIAGGGGSSKTGVHNQINVIELVPSNGACSADLATKYKTPDEIPDAVMTAALMLDTTIKDPCLVTGGTNAAVYMMNFDPASRRYTFTGYEILKHLKPMAEVKCVCYTPGRILTGGIDGHLACWTKRRVAKEIKAHSKEIDEIDVNLVNKHLVTLSRAEGRFVIWDLNDFAKINEYSNKDMKANSDISYCARSCRYAYDKTSESTNGNNTTVTLLVACNPLPAKNQPSIIYKWTAKSTGYQIEGAARSVTTDGIMAMTVSLDGRYVGIGTRSGGVSVFEVKNLKQIYKIDNAHYNAVTSLAFLPPKRESHTLTNCNLCPLLSGSIDRRVVLHRPKSISSPMRLLRAILFLIVIFFLYFTLSGHYNIKSDI